MGIHAKAPEGAENGKITLVNYYQVLTDIPKVSGRRTF